MGKQSRVRLGRVRLATRLGGVVAAAVMMSTLLGASAQATTATVNALVSSQSTALAAPVVGLAATPSGKGY